MTELKADIYFQKCTWPKPIKRKKGLRLNLKAKSNYLLHIRGG